MFPFPHTNAYTRRHSITHNFRDNIFLSEYFITIFQCLKLSRNLLIEFRCCCVHVKAENSPLWWWEIIRSINAKVLDRNINSFIFAMVYTWAWLDSFPYGERWMKCLCLPVIPFGNFEIIEIQTRKLINKWLTN